MRTLLRLPPYLLCGPARGILARVAAAGGETNLRAPSGRIVTTLDGWRAGSPRCAAADRRPGCRWI